MTNRINRRTFLHKSAALAAAPALARAATLQPAGANARIRIGLIGAGNRPKTVLLPKIHAHRNAVDHTVVALADPWKPAREKTADHVRKLYGHTPELFTNYRDLLEMKDLDAVMIASPDHLHTTHLEAAAQAGKHAYCEKPLGNDLDRCLRAIDAAQAAGIIVQIGTQQRSMAGSVGARDFYRTGLLGHVSRIEEVRNGEQPYWLKHLEDVDQVTRDNLDWQEFLGHLDQQPFDPRKFAAWYGYYEFSKGPVPQWGAHFIDLAHFITGCGYPESCMCQGGIYTWKDENDFTVPDQVQAAWNYPEGFMLSYTTNFGNGYGSMRRMYGDKGIMKLDNWDDPVVTAEGAGKRDGSIRGVREVDKPQAHPDHWLDWLDCMARGSIETAAPAAAGLQHAVAVIMANTSLETGRRTTWDPRARTINLA